MAFSNSCEYHSVRMSAIDLNGLARCKTIPGCRTSKHMEKNRGLTIISLCQLFGQRGELIMNSDIMDLKVGNVRLAVQPDTLHPMTWIGTKNTELPRRHGQFICEVQHLDGKPLEADSRYTARKMLDKLYESHKLRLFSTFEMEFRIFDLKELKSPHPKPDLTNTFNSDNADAMEPYLSDLQDALLAANVEVEAYNAEYGIGQWEFNLAPKFGITAADGAFIFKEAARGCARNHGIRASFMTKPYPTDVASGAHFNHSLWNSENENVMFDPEDKDHLSSTARHWIAGLLAHAKGIQALSGPTVNCYRRFYGGFAPGKITWGMDDRLSAIRAHGVNSSETYLENRIGTSAANPYLIMAATVAAGLDGLDRKLELPPESESQGNLATTLEEALTALEQDSVIVESLGSQLIKWFLDNKRLGELKTLEGVDIIQQTNEAMQREINQYIHI